MHLGMTGEGIAPLSPMPSPESRVKRLSTSPEGRGKNSAFSLVELSIVLVILGLLVGGVLSGQSLIRAAELRSVSTDFSRYVAATQTFRDKYFAIPGDMTNATAFWGFTGGTGCINSSGTAATTPGACDGDGSGLIGGGAQNTANERPQFWRHLANAGLVEGSYTGISGAAGLQQAIPGVNAPRSKISSAVFYVGSAPNYAGDTAAYAGDYGNFLSFSIPAVNAFDGPVLKPEEAWNIDTKMDDGKPGTGTIIARYWNNLCTTSTANNDYAGVYKLSDSTTQCSLYFLRAF